ncbi:MAG TPA: energy-coupling factor transporter ATPase [Candidatus Ventricola gallistercoris]|nr:energy-coupling factor transporter ATPase [Candidatus Ventricola gallistercoris]
MCAAPENRFGRRILCWICCIWRNRTLANLEENRIIASNLVYTYPEAKKNAVDDVSMRVKRGEFLAILGHNGSGKSTLAKLFNALYVPTDGTVWVCGLDTRDDDLVFDIRQHAGMVFQNPDNQIVATVVEEDVAFGLENNGVPPAEIRVRIDEALRAVNMSAFAKKAPHMLSGGQKQRVAIAGVLAMKPDVIILDESTAMLDPSGRQEVMNTVHRLNEEEGISVVIITHYMAEAATADYVIVMDEGKIAMSGTPREVFRQVERVRALGLDVPPMTDLAHMLRADGLSIREDVLTVDEMVEEVCRLSSKM